MSNIVYFFRRNSWIFKLIYYPAGVAFLIVLLGYIFPKEGVSQTKLLVWLVALFVVALVSCILSGLFENSIFCQKCGRTGAAANPDSFSFDMTYRCAHCGNSWKVERPLKKGEHPRGCQCYDCMPWR